MYPSVRESFISFIIPFEGRADFMYLDTRSLVTTGIGNLIDADDPKNFGSNAHLQPYAYGLGWFDKDNPTIPSENAEIDQEYNTVKFSGTAGQSIGARKRITTLRIADSAIDNLVLSQLDNFEASLRSTPEFAALDTWPADAQLGLLSMAWAMGPAFAQKGRWPEFRKACAAKDWTTAANESQISGARAERNQADRTLFSNAAQVTQQGLDYSVLQYPSDLAATCPPDGTPGPTVTRLDPSSGSAGETVVITGQGFTDAYSVGFGDISVPEMSVDSDTQITVTVPEGSSNVAVTVFTPIGSSSPSSAAEFVYL